MYTASSILKHAIEYRIPRNSRRSTISQADKKKKRYRYCNDNRDYYRKVYLKSQHWNDLKKEKLKLSPICEVCGSKRSLDVHHEEYRNLYDVLLVDLKTLCRKCHKAYDFEENKHKRNKKGVFI